MADSGVATRSDPEVFGAEMRADMQALRVDLRKELRIFALRLGAFGVGLAGIAVAIVKLA